MTSSRSGSFALEKDEKTATNSAPLTNQHPISKFFRELVPFGGYTSSACGLVSATLGAGIISLPYAFATCGAVMATILIIFVLLLTAYSLVLLGRVGKKLQIETYPATARVLLGDKVDYLVAISMCMTVGGGGIGYIITIGNILQTLFIGESIPDFFKDRWGRNLVTAGVFFVLIWPLCLPKRVNTLRYVSLVGVFFIIFFDFALLLHAAKHIATEGLHPDMILFRGSNHLATGLGIIMFGFLCQSNGFEVYFEMRPRPSIKKMAICSYVGMIIVAVLYWLSGFFGYAEFGPSVTPSVLLMYDPLHEPVMAVAFTGIIVKILSAFALHQIPFRDSMYHMMGLSVNTISTLKNMLWCSLFAIVLLILGLLIPQIDIVFGFVGSFCGGLVGFVLPALFIMYAGDWSLKKVGLFNYISTYLLLYSGVVAIVFGTGATIYGIFA